MSDRRCTICGGKLPTDARVDAQFCSGKCRQQAARDRERSDAQVIVGGALGPVMTFAAPRGSCGRQGAASIECQLRGEPQRGPDGRVPVELTVAGKTVWSGWLERLTRAPDSGAVTITASGQRGIPSESFATEPRTLAARDVRLSSFASAAAAPLAVVVRGVGYEARRVGADPLASCHASVAHRTQAACAAHANALARALAAGLLHIEADTDDATLTPGAQVRIEEAGDVLLQVVRLEYRFSLEGGLVAHFEALHLPPVPTLQGAIGIPAVVIGESLDCPAQIGVAA